MFGYDSGFNNEVNSFHFIDKLCVDQFVSDYSFFCYFEEENKEDEGIEMALVGQFGYGS